MIQANELRIGNCIFNEQMGQYVTITGDILFAVYNDIEINKNYHAIPLTPEILEKAGFVKVDADKYLLIFEGDWHLEAEDMGEQYDIWLYEDDKNKSLPIALNYKYLHQLQNLYFALTGEELTANL
jgi:hypothetical protein